jgi:hypothetical protein
MYTYIHIYIHMHLCHFQKISQGAKIRPIWSLWSRVNDRVVLRKSQEMDGCSSYDQRTSSRSNLGKAQPFLWPISSFSLLPKPEKYESCIRKKLNARLKVLTDPCRSLKFLCIQNGHWDQGWPEWTNFRILGFCLLWVHFLGTQVAHNLGATSFNGKSCVD